MHFSTALATVAAVAPLVSAHGSGLPKIVGLNPRDLKARNVLSNLGARFAEVHEYAKAEAKPLKARDDRECGKDIGVCATGVCCSQAGYCGTTPDHCYAPGCDYAYGPGCPDNVTPTGTNTSSIARTKVGSVEYGGDGIYNCVTPGTIALTYDDGPQKAYTAHILDLMQSYNAKATFFVTGNNINKGQIDTTAEYVQVIKRMYAEGHQIASHTWTHLDLSAVSSLDRKNQMWKLEMALRNIIGKIPTYMRPPYSSCTGTCKTDMADLGYHVTYFDVDTDDYNQDTPEEIQRSKDWFKGNITQNGATATGGAKWLDIQHDIHDQTANNLTEYMLKTLTDLGYKAVTVGECLGDPEANWYRSADGAATASTTGTATRSSSAPASTGTKKVSTDATCGGTNGYTCLGSTFGNCCSANGWCGSTTDYCGTGCQSAYGNCGSNSASSIAASTSKAASSVAVSTTKSASSTVNAASSTVKTSTAASSTATKKVSTDGTCAGTSGFTCTGSTYGNCCSAYGWCGSTTDHCGSTCNSSFGTCSGSSSVNAASSTVKTSSSTVKPASSTTKAVSSTVKTTTTKTSSAASTATKKASTDGTCAGSTGFTCTGSTYGNCCSQYGWCGSTTGHCSTGCQTGFGTCT